MKAFYSFLLILSCLLAIALASGEHLSPGQNALPAQTISKSQINDRTPQSEETLATQTTNSCSAESIDAKRQLILLEHMCSLEPLDDQCDHLSELNNLSISLQELSVGSGIANAAIIQLIANENTKVAAELDALQKKLYESISLSSDIREEYYLTQAQSKGASAELARLQQEVYKTQSRVIIEYSNKIERLSQRQALLRAANAEQLSPAEAKSRERLLRSIEKRIKDAKGRLKASLIHQNTIQDVLSGKIRSKPPTVDRLRKLTAMKPSLEKRLEILRANVKYIDDNRFETQALSAKVKALSKRLNSRFIGALTAKSLAVTTAPHLLGLQLALYAPNLGCFHGQDKAPYFVEKLSWQGQCEPYLNQAGIDLLSDEKAIEAEQKRNPQYVCDYVNNLYDHVMRGSAALAKYKPSDIQTTSCRLEKNREVIQIEYDVPQLVDDKGDIIAQARREKAKLEHQNGQLIRATRLHPTNPKRETSILEFDDGIIRRVQVWTGVNNIAANRFGGPEYLVRSPDYTPSYDLISKYGDSLKPATQGENINNPALFWQQIAPFVKQAIAQCDATPSNDPSTTKVRTLKTAVK